MLSFFFDMLQAVITLLCLYGMVWYEQRKMEVCVFYEFVVSFSLSQKNVYAITVLIVFYCSIQGSAIFNCFLSFSFIGGLEQQVLWLKQPYWPLWFNPRWLFIRSVVFMVIILWWTFHLHFKTNASSLSCTAKELPNSTKPSTAQKRNLRMKRTVNDHRGKKI